MPPKRQTPLATIRPAPGGRVVTNNGKTTVYGPTLTLVVERAPLLIWVKHGTSRNTHPRP